MPDAEAQIARMIEGAPPLDGLDLLAQRRLAEITRHWLNQLLQPAWFRTDAVLAQARLYFDGYQPEIAGEATSDDGHKVLQTPSIRDYCCFVLLDFVTADRDLEELPLAAALTLAERLDVKPRFMELAKQELRLRKSQLEKIDDDKATLLDRAASATV